MVFVTSDIHGKFDSLKRLLAAADFGEDDWLWIIGDVIDRNGDGGVEMLKWLLLQPNVQLILGNHEALMLSNRWLLEEVNDESIDNFGAGNISLLSVWEANGGGVTMNALQREDADTRQAIFEYIEECPTYEETEVGGKRYVLVHGGLGGYARGKSMEDYTEHELLWERPALSTVYAPDEYTVIVGHTPTVYYGKEHGGRMLRTDGGWWNIDTGAAISDGHPMLLCLDTMKKYYITGDSVVSES